MSFLVVIALVVAIAVGFLPCLMAWSYYFGGSKKTSEKRVLHHAGIKTAESKA